MKLRFLGLLWVLILFGVLAPAVGVASMLLVHDGAVRTLYLAGAGVYSVLVGLLIAQTYVACEAYVLEGLTTVPWLFAATGKLLLVLYGCWAAALTVLWALAQHYRGSIVHGFLEALYGFLFVTLFGFGLLLLPGLAMSLLTTSLEDKQTRLHFGEPDAPAPARRDRTRRRD